MFFDRKNIMAIKNYKDGAPFTGVIGRTTEESSPEPPRPAQGDLNAVLTTNGQKKSKVTVTGSQLTYMVRILDGEMPACGGPAARISADQELRIDSE
jgi:hypothetical protein